MPIVGRDHEARVVELVGDVRVRSRLTHVLHDKVIALETRRP